MNSELFFPALGMKQNPVAEKTFAFASRIVKAYRFLTQEQREYVLSKQLLRSGTSIGANVEEAIAAASKADFVNKLTIAAKEVRETHYWLRLLHENDYLPTSSFESLQKDIEEIRKIITSILLTTKNNSELIIPFNLAATGKTRCRGWARSGH